MSYKETIDMLSNAIINFDCDINPGLVSLIDNRSFDRIRVYRKNYFFGAYESLSQDFEGLKSHCEEDNFKFLVRDFLLKNKIRSLNINDLSEAFVAYLDTSLTLHQDSILTPLAVVDLLYNNGQFRNFTQVNVPFGTFDYWCFLNEQKDSYDKIDLNQSETITVIDENGERYLGKLGITNEV